MARLGSLDKNKISKLLAIFLLIVSYFFTNILNYKYFQLQLSWLG